jgi:hypothetical protein
MNIIWYLWGERAENGTTDKNAREGKKGSLSISVYLSMRSGTVSLVSAIDICDQGCRLEREGGAHNGIWWEPAGTWSTQFQFVFNVHGSVQGGPMIGHCHYQGHLEANVGVCLHRSPPGDWQTAGFADPSSEELMREMGRVHAGIFAK